MHITSAAVSSFVGSPFYKIVISGLHPQAEMRKERELFVPIERVLNLKLLYRLYLL